MTSQPTQEMGDTPTQAARRMLTFRFGSVAACEAIDAMNAAGLDIVPVALLARNAELEKALRPFANLANGYDNDIDSDDRPVGPVALRFCRLARAALKAGGGA